MIFVGWSTRNHKPEVDIHREKLKHLGGVELNIVSGSNLINMMYFNAVKCSLNSLNAMRTPYISNTLVIIFCGSNGIYEKSLSKISIFLSKGYSVLSFNYPGYGKSDGTPSVKSFYKTAEDVYKFAKYKLNHRNLLIYSISLGSGPISYLASKYDETYILDRPFNKLSSVTEYNIYNNFLPKSMQNKFGRLIAIAGKTIVKLTCEFNNGFYISKSNSKIIILYASADEMIPISEIELLVHSNPSNITLFEMEGGHGLTKKCWIDISHDTFDGMIKSLNII